MKSLKRTRSSSNPIQIGNETPPVKPPPPPKYGLPNKRKLADNNCACRIESKRCEDCKCRLPNCGKVRSGATNFCLKPTSPQSESCETHWKKYLRRRRKFVDKIECKYTDCMMDVDLEVDLDEEEKNAKAEKDRFIKIKTSFEDMEILVVKEFVTESDQLDMNEGYKEFVAEGKISGDILMSSYDSKNATADHPGRDALEKFARRVSHYLYLVGCIFLTSRSPGKDMSWVPIFIICLQDRARAKSNNSIPTPPSTTL
jgi:hypothetical protein